jgi:hypothetical protein
MNKKIIFVVVVLLLLLLPLLPLFPPEVDIPKTNDIQDASIQKAESLYRDANYEEAIKKYYVLASEGNPFAQYMTGFMYFYGEGITKNICEATYWFDKSARSGYGFAQFELARAYFQGYGIEQNDTKAYLWIRRSLENLKEQDAKSRIISIAKTQYNDIEDSLNSTNQLNQASTLFESWEFKNEEPVKIIRLRKIPVFDLILREFYSTVPCDDYL